MGFSERKGRKEKWGSLMYLQSKVKSNRNTTYTFIPDTLFNGTTPRLSCLELHKCTTSWKSPLLKGIRHLKIRLSSEHLRPSLSDWLDALNCQELDSSWALGMSKTMILWEQGFSGTRIKGSEESAKLKLDRRWEGDWIGQEVDKYKTEGKA